MDGRAFEKAVKVHKDRVHSFASLMLRDRCEAEDVAQEALIRLWEHRDTVDPLTARPWLMRTAHNLCIDRIRRRRVRSEVDDGEAVMERRADDHPGPQRLVQAGRAGQAILAALRTLPDDDRAVVLLREVEALSYEEIAGILSMPLGTLKAKLHRAREKLRKSLARTGVAP